MKMRRGKGKGTVQAWFEDGDIFIREKVGRDVQTVAVSKKEFLRILQEVVPADTPASFPAGPTTKLFNGW